MSQSKTEREFKLVPPPLTQAAPSEIVGKVRLRHAVAKALYQLYGYQARRL